MSAPSLASDCVGGLLRELKLHSSAGRISLLVAIEHANSLYGKTKVKRADHTFADPNEFSLIVQFRKLFRKDWVRFAVGSTSYFLRCFRLVFQR